MRIVIVAWRIFSAAALAAFLFSVPLEAEENQALDELLSDQAVSRALQMALGKIALAKCSGKPCGAATEAEKANPPISIATARVVMKAGLLSGAAEICGLDWRTRIYQPFMVAHQFRNNLNSRQMTLSAMIHGIMQKSIKASFAKQKKQCSELFRANIEKQITAANAPKIEQ